MESNRLHVAPGTLEIVRAFVNTWHIPHTTRVPTDDLALDAAIPQFQAQYFPLLTRTSDPAQVRRLRDNLRAQIDIRKVGVLNDWLAHQKIYVKVRQTAIGPLEVEYVVEAQADPLCGAILALVLAAVAAGTWARIKACPDCRWVFFDHTKNGSKVWCAMQANSPDGRSCGAISKVTHWRKQHNVRDQQIIREQINRNQSDEGVPQPPPPGVSMMS